MKNPICLTSTLSWIVGVMVLMALMPHSTNAMMQRSSLLTSTVGNDVTPAAETITVTTTEDLDTINSKTCIDNLSDPCTLRRAIAQARASTNKPVTIAFDLPTTDSNYDSTNDVWLFEFSGFGSELPRVNGQTIIDGTTQSSQTGARPAEDGPSVFIIGTPLATQFTRMVFDNDQNTLRGVGFQYASAVFNGRDNTIEDNWFGLTLDGTDIQFPDDDPSRDNRATIETTNGETGNTIQNNVLAGGRSDAISLRSSNSTVTNNWIGTRADGTIPDVSENLICRSNAENNNWFGGDGINVSGDENTVTNNVLVGMLTFSSTGGSTPPAAIEVARSDNTIEDNQIGIQENGTKRWVCGIGVRLTDDGHNILTNQIVNPAGGAIGIFGTAATLSPGGITIQGNTIENSDGIAAIFFGNTVPVRYANFNPAQITSIEGTTVSGSNGEDGIIPPNQTFPSTCNNCTIEVFLDDMDDTVELLQSLGTTTSNSNGDWTLELSSELSDGQGLRTISTTSEFDQIQNLSGDTSTRVSELYTPESESGSGAVYIPLIVR